MTTIQKKQTDPTAHLSHEQVEELGRELDAIRQSILDTRGADDAAYIRKVIDIQRLEDSLIGKEAVVSRSHLRPRALRLMVGDHCQIDVE